MDAPTYLARRDAIERYFDRTATAAWAQLTSDAPVSGIRATVRAGRERMRETLLGWLPEDLHGRTVLDAGCGTGALSVEAARRGARVVAIDLSPNMVELARERTPADLAARIEYRAGDMLDPALGSFDHVVAMDSLIHYEPADIVRALARVAPRTRGSLVFTFAPRTPALAVMHAVGRAMPGADRAPSIVPVAQRTLDDAIDEDPALLEWAPGRSARVSSGFYTSQAMELVHR